MVTVWVPLAMPPRDVALLLSRKHLGAQRGHEGLVVTRALAHWSLGIPRGYQQHAAVRGWRGHLRALAEYQIEMCLEWRRRRYDDGCLHEYVELRESIPGPTVWPPWWGLSPLHRQHAESLVNRDPEHYAPQLPGVPAIATDGTDEFLWPPDPTAPDFDDLFAAQVAEYDERLREREAYAIIER